MFEEVTVYEGQMSEQMPQQLQQHISKISYDPLYHYLLKDSQYLLLKDIHLHPHQKTANLSFYQNLDSSQGNEPQYNKREDYLKKICQVRDYGNERQMQIRLPNTKNDIQVQIRENQDYRLYGTLEVDYQQSKNYLYDREGIKQGYMSYNVKEIMPEIQQGDQQDEPNSKQSRQHHSDHDDDEDSILQRNPPEHYAEKRRFRTIKEEEQQEERHRALSNKMSKSKQAEHIKYTYQFIDKKQEDTDSLIDNKMRQKDSRRKLQNMKNIKTQFLTNASKVYQNNSNSIQQPSNTPKYTKNMSEVQIRKAGFIKSFKLQRKIMPSKIIEDFKLYRQQKPQWKDKALLLEEQKMKQKLKLISKNLQMSIQSKRERANIMDIYTSYQKINEKDRVIQLKKPVQNMTSVFRNLDLVITNISINLYQKTYGRKHLLMILQPFSYHTEPLYGSHLLWIGKGYHFRNILSFNELIVIVKVATDYGEESIITTKFIPVSQILNDQNKSFHQSFLLDYRQQKIGVIILGFQVNKRAKSYEEYSSLNTAQKKNRNSQNKTSHHHQNSIHSRKNSYLANSIIYQHILKDNRVNSLKSVAHDSRKKDNSTIIYQYMSKDKRVNSLKSGIQDSRRKYNGGKNIKLSKADRFAEPKQKYPGPGEYAIDSIFNRYK